MAEDEQMPAPGSIISLVSTKNVRYEGTLVHIDMDAPTPSLRLKNVRSYGTEGRGDPREAKAPTKDVFADIVFRGNDITQLDVKQHYFPPPPPQPYQGGYGLGTVDQTSLYQQVRPSQQIVPPASQPPMWGSLGNEFPVSASLWGAGTQPGVTYPSAPMSSNIPIQQHGAPAPMVVVTPQAPQLPPQAVPPRPGQTSQAGQAKAQGWGADTSSPFGAVQSSQQNAQQAKANLTAPPGFNSRPPGMQPVPPPPAVALPAQAVVLTTPAGAPGLAPQIAVNAQPAVVAAQAAQVAPQVEIARAVVPQAAPLQPPGIGPGLGRGRGRVEGRGRGRGGRGRGRPGPGDAPVPREDFDFEEGLSKFDKDHLKEESNNVPELEEAGSGAAYNKDDFFDALSSDLKDRLSTGERPQRPRFSDLRKVDAETFGGTGVAFHGRGRGGRRGRRGGLNPHATGMEHLEPHAERTPRMPYRGRGRGRGRGRHPVHHEQGIAVQ